MSYQVLARKWRPKTFSQLVGQDHVVQALSNALIQQRLHHAYLFTGTRGVGKTTLSRILAKSLNCATGITAEPCGICEACMAIDIGRYVDYVEMDAASNRGIADMVSLLEQAIYAPSSGRFKVYMIDEVHMLTKEAFNAMLKTLEEPPAHVKFILATTDPQKVPVTILSRCLQFNLRQMASSTITSHLQAVLTEEQIPFQPAALQLIARAASGSMRDALSLTDQAIAYGNQSVQETDVRSMLGAIDQSYLFDLVHALIANDAARLINIAQAMDARSIGFSAALNDLAALLHHLAIAQYQAEVIADDHPDRDTLLQLAGQLDAESLQLYYQICILGHRDIGLAPDEYAGFTMTLLRMLAFRPENMTSSGAANTGGGRTATPSSPRQASAALANIQPSTKVEASNSDASHSTTTHEPTSFTQPVLEVFQADALHSTHSMPTAAPEDARPSIAIEATKSFDGNWRNLVENQLKLGLARALAQHCECVGYADDHFTLRVSPAHKHLASHNYLEKLNSALNAHFGRRMSIKLIIDAEANTPAKQQAVEKAELQDQATQAIMQDRFVQGLMQEMGATIVPNSIKPLH